MIDDLEVEPVDVQMDLGLPERFVVDDDSKAAWAMRKLREVVLRQKSYEDIAKAEIERINAWLERVNRPLQQSREYFEHQLTEYAVNCRFEPDDGRKSIVLPHGKVGTRQGSDKWSVVDADVFVAWAQENAQDDVLRIKVEPLVSAVKEKFAVTDTGVVVTEDGEVVPGVEVSAGQVTAKVEVDL